MILFMKKLLDSIITEINPPITSSVIWLHGLGSDGHDFAEIVHELQLPPKIGGIRFVFPHAPMRQVTINNGYVMRAWYDIFGFDENSQEDHVGIKASQQDAEALILQQHQAGIPFSRIILAGFSQGGAMALYTGTHFPHRLAGIMGLSTYLPLAKSLPIAGQDPPPIFLAHGTHDDMLPLTFGEKSRILLEKAKYPVEWHTYPIGHEVNLQEINDASRWLVSTLSKAG